MREPIEYYQELERQRQRSEDELQGMLWILVVLGSFFAGFLVPVIGLNLIAYLRGQTDASIAQTFVVLAIVTLMNNALFVLSWIFGSSKQRAATTIINAIYIWYLYQGWQAGSASHMIFMFVTSVVLVIWTVILLAVHFTIGWGQDDSAQQPQE